MSIKILFPILFFLGGLLAFSACHTSKKITNGSVYACPMHPGVTGKKGDHCPKCSMELQKTDQQSTCCCADHKECMGKKGDKCPKCGKPMEEPAMPYSCPMHPDQKGKKGDHCPKCNMQMEPQKPGKNMGK